MAANERKPKQNAENTKSIPPKGENQNEAPIIQKKENEKIKKQKYIIDAFQEDLDFDAFAAKMCQDLGCNKKDTAAMLKKARKEMLKGQPKMLKDDFYHAFDAKTKKRLLQNGALSGCIVGTDLM